MSDTPRRREDALLDQNAFLEAGLLTEKTAGAPVPVIPRRSGTGPAPLSFAQQRLWFLDQLDAGKPHYNLPLIVRIRGPLDVERLAQAIDDMIERHEALRTTVAVRDGVPLQIVGTAPSRILARRDLSHLPVEERDAALVRLAHEELARPFDLSRDLMFRAILVREGEASHVLLMTMHHIASDGLSAGLFLEEMTEVYGALIEGREAKLSELPIQYADYAVWQREWLAGEVGAKQLSYWKGKLSGELPFLDLPLDRPRPAEQTFAGAQERRLLQVEVAEGLEALARQEGTTLFMVLTAAFQALLSRLSGQEDVLVGTPIAGRNRVETENPVGFFVNTLVLRGDLSGDPTFRKHLRRVREEALEAFAHQDLPFERLVEELRPERDLAHSPLFQVMFALENYAVTHPRMAGLKLEPVEIDTLVSNFDLTLDMRRTERGLRACLEYNTDLLDRGTVRRWLESLELLLEGIVKDPEQRLSELPMLTEGERRLLAEWNATAAPFPRDKTVHRLFEEQAARSPEAVALEFNENQTLTYRELDRRSSQLAERLRGLGVGPEVLVGLCVPRSPEMVVGLLGVLKAGGAYVPFDPTYPSERLAYMLEDTGAPIVLSVERVADVLPAFAGRLLLLDSEQEEISLLRAEPGDSGATPENLAYVMYTSGSTGKPKGVMVPHRAVVNYLAWCVRAYDIEAGSGSPVQSSLSFDLTITGLFGPLLCGRSVRLVPEGFGSETLGDVLRGEGDFSLVKITPAWLDLLAHQNWPRQAAGCSRAFVIGGEPLRAENLAFWRDFTPQTALFNEYGPTETTVGCSVYRVGRDDPRTGPVPIGRPIANARIYVLDRHFQPVPIGVSGEIYVGGEGVARGYWKRPELTGERFLPDPFSGEPGARLYRTGDLGRFRADGNLDFLGRTDDQVKIRGFRVELGEVEAAMREHPSILEAAVALREDAPGDRRLVAYVVPRTAPAWSVQAMREHLQVRLPEYMVPSAFVKLDSLPVTRNGKLDRKALSPPDWLHRQPEKDYTPPRDALELQLTKVWESVLETEPIGINDDFFDLGGHSLLAVRLFAEIERVTGKKLPLATLFEAPTVGQIGDVLREGGWSSPWPSLVPIQPRGARPPFFCVHPVGGGVLSYRALSRRLGPEQPFFGIQARALQPGKTPDTTIEEMAEHYLAELRSFQPEGPYYLGGYSAGGLVAFEMARRLRAEGRTVAFLALIDSWSPGHGKLLPATFLRVRLAHLGLRLSRFLQGLTRGSLESKVSYLREKLETRARVVLGHDDDLPPDLREVRRSIERACDEYRGGTYPGRMTLFRATRQPVEYALDRTLGWGALATEEVEVHEAPGLHGELLDEPQVEIVAERLHDCLERAAGPAHAKVPRRPSVG